MADELESTTLTQQLVLLGVARRTVCDNETPHSAEVRKTCLAFLDDVEGDVVGKISEADVMRRLSELEAEELLEQVDVADQSPVGKGRPKYDLNVAAATVLNRFEDDDRVAPVVEQIRREAE